MANPQKENGYSPIANEIFEALAKTPLNGTQRRILDVVFRYTYGFSRKEHELSISFLVNAMDLKMSQEKQVRRELKALIDMKVLIEKEKPQKNSSRVLAFNKNYEEWSIKTSGLISPEDKKVQRSKKSERRGRKSPKGEVELDHQENNKQKTIKKEKQENPNTNLINYFRESYKKKFGAAYLPSWAVDGKIIKDFLDAEYTIEYLKKYIDWFLECDDKFLKNNGFKIPLLKTTLAKYQSTNEISKDHYRKCE
jgi:phage replication O-like protein O